MARADIRLVCPKSTLPWRVGTRTRAGRAGERSATCPSCGHGLILRETPAGLELVPGRNSDPATAHRLDTTRTSGGLRG